MHIITENIKYTYGNTYNANPIKFLCKPSIFSLHLRDSEKVKVNYVQLLIPGKKYRKGKRASAYTGIHSKQHHVVGHSFYHNSTVTTTRGGAARGEGEYGESCSQLT